MCQEREPLHRRVQANPHFYTFTLSAACWHKTPNQGSHPGMGGIPCLAHGSSCLALSASKPSTLDWGDGWLWRCRADGGTGKARRSGSLTGAQQLPSDSPLRSAAPSCPCQWPLTSPAGSCMPAPTLLGILGRTEACKTEAQLLCHVLTSASPAAAAFPNSWSSQKMGRGFKQGRTPSR